MKEKQLIHKYLDNSLSKVERKELINWINKDKKRLDYFKSQVTSYPYVIPFHFDAEIAFNKFQKQLLKREVKKKKQIKYLAIAASLCILIGIGAFYKWTDFNYQQTHPSISNKQAEELPQQIQITLSDGSKQILQKNTDIILMDSLGNTIAQKKKQVLSFENSSQYTLDTTMNRIDIPYGEKLQLQLSDGTLVWLNSGTTFKFPQNFSPNAKHRKVQLIGEAYFEVSENKNQPFIVDTKALDIKVLGTEFNVSSYDNDKNHETTLMEGSVQVFKEQQIQNPILLSPNEQVVLDKANRLIQKRTVDASIYNSWIEGKLVINHMTFSQILKKLERRHDVQIINNAKGIENNIYRGEFNKESLQETLETIALSSNFSFIINGNQVIINNDNT